MGVEPRVYVNGVYSRLRSSVQISQYYQENVLTGLSTNDVSFRCFCVGENVSDL
ncbi:hypothetical protein C5167_007103 [Papaver somniferum]|uniref:Uncharacterized protein n=1 Tax=Papaver somniferum TaxID=3469 RepID=A0A4Y7JGY3_PAPSO|nr:hypothetical protein C5167_007103 [Papaver somniferum]